MKLKIRTKDIEIEYSDDYSMITGDGKRRIIEILESTFEKQKELNLIKSELVELDMDFEEEKETNSIWCEYCNGSTAVCTGQCGRKDYNNFTISNNTEAIEQLSKKYPMMNQSLSGDSMEHDGVPAKADERSMRYWQDPNDIFPDMTSQEAKKKYKDYLTVGKLKKGLEFYPDDAIVVSQRVEDVYYEKHGWETIKKDDNLYPGHKQEYTPVWSIVHYKDDHDCLFLDLHY